MFTVKQLIEELSKYPEDMPVLLYANEEECTTKAYSVGIEVHHSVASKAAEAFEESERAAGRIPNWDSEEAKKLPRSRYTKADSPMDWDTDSFPDPETAKAVIIIGN